MNEKGRSARLRPSIHFMRNPSATADRLADSFSNQRVFSCGIRIE
jgi:hypothetical protein